MSVRADALFQSAFSSLSAPASRTYDDRKRARRVSQAEVLLALARQRTDALDAMMRDGASCHPSAP